MDLSLRLAFWWYDGQSNVINFFAAEMQVIRTSKDLFRPISVRQILFYVYCERLGQVLTCLVDGCAQRSQPLAYLRWKLPTQPYRLSRPPRL